MAKYALVREGTIVNLYDSIPSSFGEGISGFHLLTDEERAAYGFLEVEQPDLSRYNPEIHEVIVDEHRLVGNTPTRIFAYIDKFTETELESKKRRDFWNSVREYRNFLLSKSDWTMMADVLASKNQTWFNAWSAYRQQLRDITLIVELYNTYSGNANRVEYPKEPNL